MFASAEDHGLRREGLTLLIALLQNSQKISHMRNPARDLYPYLLANCSEYTYLPIVASATCSAVDFPVCDFPSAIMMGDPFKFT